MVVRSLLTNLMPIFELYVFTFANKVQFLIYRYGDKAPRTILGKVLGVFWMLAGLIITTMFISIITASLASVSLQGRSDLRGVKVILDRLLPVIN